MNQKASRRGTEGKGKILAKKVSTTPDKEKVAHFNPYLPAKKAFHPRD